MTITARFLPFLQKRQKGEAPSNTRKSAILTGSAAILIAILYGLLISALPLELVVGSLWLIIMTAGAFLAPSVTLGLYVLLVLIIPDFKGADALTLYMLALYSLKSWRAFDKREPNGASVNLFIAFLLWCAGEVVHGYFRSYGLPSIYNDARSIFIYWLWAPLLILLWRRGILHPQAPERIILFVAAAVSIVALIQAFTGIQIVAGRVSELDTTPGVTRVQFSGFTFCLAAIALITARRLTIRKISIIHILLLFLNLAGIYVNYGRALWAWTIISLIVCFLLVGLKKSWATILTLLCAITLLITALSIYKPDILDVLSERMASVTEEGGSRTSYGWRRLENEAATQKIISSPMLGIGIGGVYRNWIAEISNFADHIRYIHNNYFYLATKTGIPGLLFLLIALLLRGLEVLKKKFRGEMINHMEISFLAVLVSIFGLSMTQPELSSPISSLLLVILVTQTFKISTKSEALAI